MITETVLMDFQLGSKNGGLWKGAKSGSGKGGKRAKGGWTKEEQLQTLIIQKLQLFCIYYELG